MFEKDDGGHWKQPVDLACNARQSATGPLIAGQFDDKEDEGFDDGGAVILLALQEVPVPLCEGWNFVVGQLKRNSTRRHVSVCAAGLARGVACLFQKC